MPTETVLQIIVMVLVTISLGLAGWCLREVVSMKERMARHEGEDSERKDDYDRRFKEVREQQSHLYGELKEYLGKLNQSIDALHRRIDQLISGRNKQGGV